MVISEGGKIVELARHMTDNGPNPSTLPIVLRTETESGKFIVLDGNRRLNALRILEDPTLVDDLLTRSARNENRTFKRAERVMKSPGQHSFDL